MGVTVRQKTKGRGEPWWVFIAHNGKRKSIKVGDKAAAEALASELRQRLGIINWDKFMAIRERINKSGKKSYQVDYYDADNKRKMKVYKTKREAKEAELINKLEAAKEKKYRNKTMALCADLTEGYVYFLQLDYPTGPIKIGYSKDPEYRMRQHIASCPYECLVLGIIPGSVEKEREVHHMFKQWLMAGKREMFRADKTLLFRIERLIEEANKNIKIIDPQTNK